MAENIRQAIKKLKMGALGVKLILILAILVVFISIRSFTACRELGFYDLTWSPGTQIAYTRANYFCTFPFCSDALAVYTVDEAGHQKEIKSNLLGEVGLAWSPDGYNLAFSAGYGFNAGQSSKCFFAVFDINESFLKCLSHTNPIFAPAFSPDRTRIAFWSSDDALNIMDSDGNNVKKLPYITGTVYQSLSWSPDSASIAYVSDFNGSDAIYTVKSDGSSPTRLTKDPYDNWAPEWSPDGTRIAFLSRRGGFMGGPTPAAPCGLPTNCGYPKTYTMKSDGTDVKLLINSPADDGDAKWSPDGSKLVLVSQRDGNPEIYIVNPDGTDLVRLTDNRAENSSPVWSPDGTRIAYISTRNGYSNIYVMNADGTNVVQLTRNPANAPCLPIP